MCCLFLSTSLPVALADVTLDGIIRGEITVDSPTATTQEMFASDGAIGHFSNFDIAAGHFVNCDQPSTDASALFRVFSGDGTQIYGQFDATGHIYLVDTAGILFGPDSVINVTRLVASGLDISDPAFDTIMGGGQMEFANGDGEITNRGKIYADDVYLIGDQILNLGTIQAPDGLVVMAAGDQVFLAQDGSDVSVTVSSLRGGLGNPDISNRNGVYADTIILAAGDTFSSAITNVSFLAASGGTVKLQAAIIENNGSIDVDAPTSSADGGNISLIATDEIIIDPAASPYNSLTANADATGNGGNITIETEGTVTIGDNAVITASGGSTSGDGGTVSITCDDFVVTGEISASPGNKINEPGNLEITTPSVIIADGVNAGETDTLYEKDIEALSQGGTNLVVNAEEGITIKDITDNEITGQFGSIKLFATGDESAVTFADNTVDGTPEISDTIRTTLGDIIIEAGSGGINAGNLITGEDLPDEKPAPGMIFLTSNNGGDITTGDLIIEDGWGHAEINVKSDSDLTVNGDVKVGKNSYILNAPPEAAEAMVYLKARDNVVLNGEVCADAHGMEAAEDITKAYIEISAGGDAEINGDLWAEAQVSNNGTAEATVKVEAVGDITFAEGVEIDAIADDAAAESNGPGWEDDEATTATGHAQIIIDESAIFPVDDIITTSKSAAKELNVLDNDIPIGDVTIDHYEDLTAGTLTPILDGDSIVDYTYEPPEDLTAFTFDAEGKSIEKVTFKYFVKDAEGVVSDNPATVTITLTNSLPVAVADKATTSLGQPIKIDVLINDTDPDLGDVLTAIDYPSTTKNGTVVMNEDGTFTYTPNEGFFGDDSFTYAITDGFNTSSEVEVKVTVTETIIPSLPSGMPPAPGLDILNIEIEVSGCPALVKWAAEEVGIDERLVQIWVANSLASTGNIQPCDACQGLKNSAKILLDADGTHIAALAQVVNEFASSTAPPTEEQMVAIADAIARNTDEDSYYAVADEYLEALTTYVGILSDEMGFSTTESVQLVTDKYVGRLAQGQNVGVAAFIAASLAALGG